MEDRVMKKNTFDDNPLHHDSTLTSKRMSSRRRGKKNEDIAFLDQNVDLTSSILFPDGYEYLMLAIYFISIPYLAGLLFIFFYIGKGDTSVLLSLNDDNSFLITWAIGYEVVASILLLWIAKLGIASFLSAGKKKHKGLVIP